MKLVFVPGAYSSPICWAYFKKEMPDDIEVLYLDYNPELPLEDILKSFEKRIENINEDIFIVGHSLGGILSMALAQRSDKIKRGVTVAAPYGGILISRWMVYLSMFLTPFNNLWANTHPDNKILSDIRNKDMPIDLTVFLVETQNSTMWFQPSDGVVTIQSQIGLGEKKRVTYEKIYCTHADSILHDRVIEEINIQLKS